MYQASMRTNFCCFLQRPLFLLKFNSTLSFRCLGEHHGGSAEENHWWSGLYWRWASVPCEIEHKNTEGWYSLLWWLSDQCPMDSDCSSLLGCHTVRHFYFKTINSGSSSKVLMHSEELSDLKLKHLPNKDNFITLICSCSVLTCNCKILCFTVIFLFDLFLVIQKSKQFYECIHVVRKNMT